MIPIPTQGEDDNVEGAGAVWGFLIVLFLFKLVTVVLIFWHMRTWEAAAILGSSFWYFIPPMILLVAGPAIFYYRLRKVRSRRDALRRAEWMIEEEDAPVSAARRH